MMGEANTVRSHLQARFEQQRVVIWHDPEREYTTRLEQISPDGVRILRVENNEYAIKNLVTREEPEARFLIYRAGPVPVGTGNWLLDMELAYGVFTADRVALIQQDLGLLDAEISQVIPTHEAFFSEAELVEKLKQLLRPEDDARMLNAKMCAVLLGQNDHSLLELTRTLLVENATGSERKYNRLVSYGLTEFYWQGAATIYGYRPEKPSIPDFILWMFRQASNGFKSDSLNTLRNIQLDFGNLRNDRRSQSALMALAKRVSRDLEYSETILTKDFRELLDDDLFEETDQKIITDLAHGVAHRTITNREVVEAQRRRQTSIWIGSYAKLYSAIGSASSLITTIESTPQLIRSFDDGLEQYKAKWYLVDQDYRKFLYAARTADFSAPLEGLRSEVEKIYTNKYLYSLGNAWQQQVDNVDRWQSSELRNQTSFYNDYVLPIIKDGRRKAVVIISDALRYEVADELGSRIRQQDRYEASLQAMLGVLPSYTQLGMAALLPHRTIGHSPDGDPVLVDGEKTDGTENRSKILGRVGGQAIRAEDVFSLTRDELRERYSNSQVLYIYHDRIDATGDKPGTERQVFEAAENTLREIVELVKRLTSANATNIFITADHGFLFQDTALSESFYLSTLPQGDDIKVKNRRYVLGNGLKPDPAFTTFSAAQLGLDSDLDVQVPRSIHRLRLPGAGSRFVHGGASLQEVVLPVLVVNKKRKSDVRPVAVNIMPESDKITTGQLVVNLFQAEKITDKVHPLSLRAGLFVGEKLVSNYVHLTFDTQAEDPRERYQKAHMLLTREADNYNNRSVEFRLEEQIDNTSYWRTYSKATYMLKRSFTSDFDF